MKTVTLLLTIVISVIAMTAAAQGLIGQPPGGQDVRPPQESITPALKMEPLVVPESLSPQALVSPSKGKELVELPRVRKGDKTIMWHEAQDNLRTSYPQMFEVVEVTEDRIVVRTGLAVGKPTLITFDREWNRVSSEEGGQRKNYSPAYRRLSFPLYVGKTWRTDEVRITSTSWSIPLVLLNVTAKVLAFENVTVPAGTFMAYKVHVGTTFHWEGSILGHGRQEETFWYAPSIGRVVKSIYDDGRGKTMSVIRNFIPGPASPPEKG